MNSINLRKRLIEERDAIFGMPETVYRFADYLVLNIPDRPLIPDEVITAITEAVYTFKSGSAQVFVVEKEKFLFDARFILQVIDSIAEEEFADAVRKACAEKLGWKPVKRAKILDCELFSAIFSPSIIAAVEWWTTLLQLSEEETVDDDASYKPYTGFSIDEMFDFRYQLAISITDYLDGKDFFFLGKRNGDTDMFSRATERIMIDDEILDSLIPDELIMCISEEKLQIAKDPYEDFITIWEAK